MFRDERIYRAVMFAAPSLRDLADAKMLFPKKVIATADPPVKCPGGSVEHLFYYSTKEFTRNVDLLAQAKEKRHGIVQYRYNMYLVSVLIGKTLNAMVAVPFKSMAQEVYLHLRNATRGQDYEFRRVLLGRAMELSEKGEDAAALLRVTRVKYNVEGDGFAESVGFVGSHLAQCTTLKTLLSTLKGPTLTPELLRISLDDRFTFATDQLGHYWFRVARHANNLVHIPEVFKIIAKLGLIESSSAFPHMKHFDEADEEAMQSNE